MDPIDRRKLLGDLTRLPTDADLAEREEERFLPLPLHNLALSDSTFIVCGERGAGKTALFRFLGRLANEPNRLRALFPNSSIAGTVWVEGFSERTKTHPSPIALETLSTGTSNEEIRLIWLIHLVGVLSELPSQQGSCRPPAVLTIWNSQRQQPQTWLQASGTSPGELLEFLDSLDTRLSSQGQTLLVTYDHLDRIWLWDPTLRARFSGALLALWHSLTTRYRYLRPKIFLREDLFNASLHAFPDASKLKARSISLNWEPASLYRVLVRQMSYLSEEVRVWIDCGGIKLINDPILGYLPPDPFLEEGPQSYSQFVEHLAGELMGAGVKKGYTYRWMLNHIQDAKARIVPRSLLNLVGNAAQQALIHEPVATGNHLLHPTDLRAALDETSRRRVAELLEEHKVVERLHRLRGRSLMIDASVVEQLLTEPLSGNDDGFGSDGRRVKEELIRLGVIRIRSDSKIDVPDLYRLGFGIKGKGGVAHPR